jgi:putative endonuclease
MFYVYVLRSKKDKGLYIGFTDNLKIRFKEHQESKVESTQYRRPLELIYYESYKDKSIARKRERQLKSGKANMALRKRLRIVRQGDNQSRKR